MRASGELLIKSITQKKRHLQSLILHLSRTTLSGPSDYENDGYCGFEIVEAREIDTIGTAGIIKKIRDRVGTTKPVYLSIDIDTLDPACM